MSEQDRRMAGEDALRDVQPKSWDAPQREQMLAQVYLRASQHKEQDMTGLRRLFSGRPLAAQLGLAALLLLALGVTALLRSEPSLAATDGVVLNYDLSAYDKEQAKSKFKEVENAVNSNLPAGVELLTANLRAEVRREKRVVKHDGVEQASPEETETTKISGVVVLSYADAAVVAKLCDDVAQAVPGVSKPEVQDATWFREHGAGLEGGTFIGLNMNGEDHSFNFPEGTSAEQMESEINAWLAQNHPGETFEVDAEVSGDGENKRVEIRIEGKHEEHSER